MYQIIEKDGLFGLKDPKGKVVVPCRMDKVDFMEDPESGLSLFDDFGAALLIKDGLYGFYFVSTNSYVEPKFAYFTFSPCDPEVAVCTPDGTYGWLQEPGWKFAADPSAKEFFEDME